MDWFLRRTFLVLSGGGLSAVMLSGCDPSKLETYESKTAAAPASAAVAPAAVAPEAGPTPAEIAKAEASLPPVTIERINDLEAIAKALEAYKAANGHYPNSGGSWAGYKMSWGKTKGENWIPELVPAYMPAVPREPTKSEDPDGPQFIYASDGQYFKVVAHYTRDCEEAIKSPRVKKDPIRTNPDGTCWAYGLWSPNGADK